MAVINSRPKLLALKSALHTACFLPAAVAFYLAATDQFGADPIKALIHFYGMGALNCLMATLVISPLIRWLREPQLVRVRRMLGLYVFFYASLHISCFLAFELTWDLSLFGSEIVKRPFITLGMAGYLILLTLAATSFQAAQRRLKKRWQTLHNLIYLLLPIAVVHFYWSVKAYFGEPLIYFAIAALLLWFRRDKLRRRLRPSKPALSRHSTGG